MLYSAWRTREAGLAMIEDLPMLIIAMTAQTGSFGNYSDGATDIVMTQYP
jgi:hypothetical protein